MARIVSEKFCVLAETALEMGLLPTCFVQPSPVSEEEGVSSAARSRLRRRPLTWGQDDFSLSGDTGLAFRF